MKALMLCLVAMAVGCSSVIALEPAVEPEPSLLALSERLEAILLRSELPEIVDLTDEQREALLHPEFGYARDYALWLEDIQRYNRLLETDYNYTTPSIIMEATDDPINAAWRLDAWAREIVEGEPGIDTAFAQAGRLLDELPVLAGVPRTPAPDLIDKPANAETFAQALESIAAFIDIEALGTIPKEHRELISFVVPWICRSAGNFANQSKGSPSYAMTWIFHPSDPFRPGDAATSRSETPVPPALHSETGLARYLYALAGQPIPPGALFFDETGEHPQFEAAVDFAALRTAVDMLAGLLSASSLDALAKSLAAMPVLDTEVPGVTGNVLRVIDTDYGPIIFGGPGPNRYTQSDFLAIIDIGGDDEYVFTDTDEHLGKRPLQVIIDFKGDDVYITHGVGGPAAGILGVSVLIDRAGDDRYIQGLSPHFTPREHTRETLVQPDPEGVDTKIVSFVELYGNPAAPDEPGVALDAGFAFGAGFLGVGVLIDEGGNDLYLGQKFAFGAGFWSGVGVLHDVEGDDVYVAGTGAIGVGINGAFGMLFDHTGDDHYQCLGTFESGYSAGRDWDNGYAGNGIGVGSSWRVERRSDTFKRSPTLGGGVGLVYDGSGDDSYIGSSFGIAAGYAGGMGIVIDENGNDTYFVKRGPDGSNRSGWSGNHALGNGCHRGVGYLLDRNGNDRYSASSLAGGTAWDLGIGFLIDLGGDDKMTDLHGKGNRGSTGWGAAYGFAVTYHQGGTDIYECGSYGSASSLPNYPGVGGNFSFFFDVGPEENTFTKKGWAGTVRNGGVVWEEHENGNKYPKGIGIFMDVPEF